MKIVDDLLLQRRELIKNAPPPPVCGADTALAHHCNGLTLRQNSDLAGVIVSTERMVQADWGVPPRSAAEGALQGADAAIARSQVILAELKKGLELNAPGGEPLALSLIGRRAIMLRTDFLALQMAGRDYGRCVLKNNLPPTVDKIG